MRRKLLLFFMILFLCACQSQSTIPTRHLNESVKLMFFYVETCSQCKAFKQEAIPYLETTFDHQITIELYDLDADETAAIYDQVIDSLQDFDESLYGMGPFYVLEGYFGTLGYTEGDEEEIANDIEKAVKHEELGYELEAYRFLYKES